jgi:hypothetical protein
MKDLKAFFGEHPAAAMLGWVVITMIISMIYACHLPKPPTPPDMAGSAADMTMPAN